ncbi:Acyl transferase/acyl hydrolase/lysophospholipase [Penicillium pulvis]|uniref:Acyl transferase/acyl hydrolase/lysophospholipase n=1 Tax=Penicillium pulvis TaxID=1562058 RepID=UPI0025474514|nr:Acyl transferase/acyl hydrolase/lysophospholipase [Penicillium pulvis]KAJ5801938.1 Acyl transferase/acyl hydrolase/lysophospholipase [Penicillium pulvis]
MTVENVGSNPRDANGLCLLSLDGGGVRGFSTLLILRDVMAQLNRERGDGQHLKPCDVFDLIGGTSTGGLIAIMLGRLELDVDECIDAYSELMESVFGERISHIPVDWSFNIRAKFDSNRLKAAIEHVITKAGASPTDLMNDGVARRTRTFVCTTSRDTLQVTRLRSYSVPNEDTLSATICEAALATSAATKFFEPATIGNRQFVDGAFGANNPVEEVEEEAADIWCTTSREIKPLIKCFLTVGTGCPALPPMTDNMYKFIKETLVNLATKPESTERRFMARWSKESKERRVFRFNVEQGLQSVRMDDCSQRSLIENATQDYLHHFSQKSRIRDCILNLTEKEGKTDLDFDLTMRDYGAQAFRNRVFKSIQSSIHSSSHGDAPCWVVPFERNPKFVNREHVRAIKRKLFNYIQPERIAIVGLGGVGKTQILLELAYQTREMYPDCAVFWIPAVDMESLEQAYRDIANNLGLDHFDPKKEDIKSVVQRHLSQRYSGRWLLIFDNADELAMWTEPTAKSKGGGALRGFLPKSDQGAIIFTTRSNRVAQYLAATDVVQIGELDEQKATKVLKNCLINKSLLNDADSTKTLLENLTFLPLAIVQAASFINQNSMDIASYVHILEGQGQDTIDLLSEDFEDEGRYRSIRNPIATTWLTSFIQIQRDNHLASEYLSFMACINAKDIPAALLPPAPQIEKEKAIGLLSSYSFVRVQNGGTRLDMHRLVQLAMQNWLKSTNTLHGCQHNAMCQVRNQYPRYDMFGRAGWRLVLPHALQVLQLTSDEHPTKERAWLLMMVGTCQYHEERHKEAERLLKQAIDCLGVVYGPDSALTLGAEHPQSMHILGELSASYRSVLNLPKAEELCMKVIRYNLKALTSSDGMITPDTHSQQTYYIEIAFFLAVNNMVSIYHHQGRLHDAVELAELGIFLARHKRGSDDLWTQACATVLADIYLEQWHLEKAEILYLEVIDSMRKVFGPVHSDTCVVMSKLATVYKYQNRTSEAVNLMTETIRVNESIFGKGHVSSLAYYTSLEIWTSPQ